METPLSIIISNPAELWALLQNGFTVKVVRWDSFYSEHKFLVKIYDLIKIQDGSKTMIGLKKISPINDGDTVYRDLTTGNYLLVQRYTTDTMRIYIVSHA
jgi:hypothetical protein